MSTLLLALSLLAADPRDELQGTWVAPGGTVLFIDAEEVLVQQGKEAFEGIVRIPKPGVFQIVIGREVAFEALYTVKDDKLTLTIDGKPVVYKRKVVEEGKG